jgi:hypothetical protein
VISVVTAPDEEIVTVGWPVPGGDGVVGDDPPPHAAASRQQHRERHAFIRTP